MGTNGVFIYPTFPFSATYHGEYIFNSAALMYTMPFNVLGLPSTSVPMGLDNKGLPIAIQVCSKHFKVILQCPKIEWCLEKIICGKNFRLLVVQDKINFVLQ